MNKILLRLVLFCSFHKSSLGFLGHFQTINVPSPSCCNSKNWREKITSRELTLSDGCSSEFVHSSNTSSTSFNFNDAITQRYTCSRFQKHEESSLEHRQVIREALEVLDLSRRAPSGFNVQPWRAIMVCSPEAKEKLSKYALAHNADRVRDSDCTVVFLADKECGREMSRFSALIQEQDKAVAKVTNRKPMSKFRLRYTQALVLLFSSGYPLPRFLGVPLSFFVRLGVATVSAITRRRILVPSLSSAECWASKNCMLFAMSYILGCTSRNLATAPMEGINTGGIRKVLGIPKRFAVPLIVSTGKPLLRQINNITSEAEGASSSNITIADPKHVYTERYAMNQVLYQDKFGQDFTITAV